jgi:hypothetical protein
MVGYVGNISIDGLTKCHDHNLTMMLCILLEGETLGIYLPGITTVFHIEILLLILCPHSLQSLRILFYCSFAKILPNGWQAFIDIFAFVFSTLHFLFQ